MKLGVWLAGLLLLSGQGIAEAALQVRVDGDRLTLSAEKAPLRDILKAIAAAGQFTLRIEPSLAHPITVQFTQRPLLEALDWLLRGQSMLIRYARERGAVRVEDVQVVAPSSPSGGERTTIPSKRGGPTDTTVPAGEVPPEISMPPDASPAERIGAALAMVEENRAEAGQAVLLQLLQTNEDPSVRGEALWALRRLPTVPVEVVKAAALADPDPSVRLQALTVLRDVEKSDPSAREALHQAAEQDQDEGVRDAAQVLGEGLREVRE